MSLITLEFIKSFVNGRITSTVFTEAYMELYRIERDNNILIKEDKRVGQCLSTIFCLADLYNPSLNRADYELDDDQLIEQVKNELNQIE
ncbi:colicin immunity domain-containing protein [Orbaceae bacterium ESL0721]|nr:colicin immunity domain-containing protein [Orbaceae bacterium ESL0721]